MYIYIYIYGIIANICYITSRRKYQRKCTNCYGARHIYTAFPIQCETGNNLNIRL